MRRRELISAIGCAAAWPFTARAEEQKRVRRIGWLSGVAPNASPTLDSFRGGMRELGWIEGRDFVFEWRNAGTKNERFPALAIELVRLNVDVIVTWASAAVRPVQQATATIPI